MFAFPCHERKSTRDTAFSAFHHVVLVPMLVMLFVFEEEEAIKGKVRLGAAETISALFDLFYCSSCMYRTVLCPTEEESQIEGAPIWQWWKGHLQHYKSTNTAKAPAICWNLFFGQVL